MGAYDNPKIIQPPNYTEIFMKNFAGGQALVEKAFAGQKAKKKEREAKLDRAYQDTSKIRVKGQAINAGDMTANVRKQANLISDDFYANELAYIDEKIDRQTYQANRDKHLGKLQGMVDIGTELGKVDLSNLKVSRHQSDKGYALGLIEAYNNQAVDIDYSGNTAKLYYMDPNNKRVEVDLNVLKDIKPEDFGINEVFDFDKETLDGLIEPYANKSFGSSTINLEDGVSKVKIETYGGDQQFKSIEEAQAANKQYETDAINAIGAELNGLYNNLDSEDRGSLFADKTFASFTNGKNENNTFQEGKEQEIEEILGGIEGMTDETIKHVKEQLLNGTYNGTDEQLSAMDEISKTFLARKLFNDSASIKKPQTDSAIASAKQLQEAARKDRIQELTLEEKEDKKKQDQDTPAQSYVDLTYKPDTYAPAVRRGINLLLKDGPKLNLTNQTSQASLLDQLQSLTASQVGDVESNHFNNMMTIEDLKTDLVTNPEKYTENTNNYSSIGSVKNGKFDGRYTYNQFIKYLDSFDNPQQIIQLPTVKSQGKVYFRINENARDEMKPIALGDDKVDNMANLLREAKIFMDVPVNILYDELKLFETTPNRFNK